MKERFKNFKILTGRLFRQKDFRNSLLCFFLIIASIIGCFFVTDVAGEDLRLTDSEIDEITYVAYDLYYGSGEEDAEEIITTSKTGGLLLA